VDSTRFDGRVHPLWWALTLFAAIALFLWLTLSLFAGTFSSYIPVTLSSERTGLVMESGAKVKMRGVQVGRVAAITGGRTPTVLQLDIFPDQAKFIPANVQAQIRATTAFGAKYVDLIYPSDPSQQRLAAGQVISSRNVSTEVNTVFQNLTDVLDKVDPVKLNGVLTALADGLRGQGPAIGQATTDANEVLLAVNPRAEMVRRDWKSVQGFADTYSAAAHDILNVLDAASTTSVAITDDTANLDALLLNTIGFARSGTSLLAPSKDNFVASINALESTTSLLLKYNPELTCTLVGGKYFLDHGGYAAQGGSNGRSAILDVAVLLGDDPYKYPDNLPVVGAKGGPGGRPGCGSLPDVAKNWPVRQLVTNTGWGTGMDWRPNPGIGFPGYANYLPVTRAVPEPPSIRYPGGPAPGPIPYPGAPPYGAPMYGPDGTPLYPGLPPAPPPGAPREPGPPPPGSEPFVVPAPAALQPTPTPPLPDAVMPSP
jgi:phospholipid/cholesterol/gamma-HCH transport system substrate-binding protein